MRAVLRSFILPFTASVVACALAACGGGGGGTSPTPANVNSGSSGGGTSTTSSGSAAATFSVALEQYAPVQTSSVKRRAAFISPATAQISLTIVSVNGTPTTGTPQTFGVGPTAPNCSTVSGIVSCNFNAVLPLGTDIVSASTLDANGHSLGTSQIAATVQQNSSNRIALSVGGTIASMEIFLSRHSFTPGGVVQTANVIVVPLDASGAAIVNPGNYNPPITLTEVNNSGATGHFSLVTDGTNTGLAATINSPNDQVVLSYDGMGTSGSTTITANAGSPVAPVSTSASFNLAGLTATPSGAQYTTTNAYVFSSAGQTGTINVSGGTAPYTAVSSDSSLVTVSGSSPTFTVTSQGYGVNGAATITITDAANATSTIPVAYLSAPIVLAISSCPGSITCTGAGTASGTMTFAIPANGPSTAISPVTIAASGGTGTFTYLFASSGTQSSPYATVAQSGGSFTITPNGSSNDAIIIFSGASNAYFGIVGTGGGAAYSIGSTFLAFAPSANSLTMSAGSIGTSQATVTLSAANGPWQIVDNGSEPCMSSSDATVTQISGGFTIAAAASSGQCQLILTPALGTAPTPLTIYFLPEPSITAPVSQTLHAIGDTGSFSINEVAQMGISDVTQSTPSVVSLTSLSIGTPSTLTFTATGFGTTRISAHDTKWDTRLGMAVGVDNAFALSLPTAIGMTAGSAYSSSTLPSTVAGGAVYGTFSGSPTPSVTVTTGSPGTVAATPISGSQGYGTIRFTDAAGGHADVPFTVFSIAPVTYPGSLIGASATEAFSATGQVDTVTIGGANGAITATPADSHVVTTSVSGSTITVTAVGVGSTTIAVTDSTGASVSYTVSVTTTTIPIAGLHRRS